MRNLWIPLVLLGGCPLLFGQLDSGTLTVTATRTMAVLPDQVAFTASLPAGVGTTLDEILALVAPAGITAANQTGVYSSFPPTTLIWNFSWRVPLSNMKETIA